MSRRNRTQQEDLFADMQGATETPPSIASWEERTRRPLVEETSKRSTFLIDLELLERLNRMSATQKRGFKTWLVNEAIRDKLDQLEEEGL